MLGKILIWENLVGNCCGENLVGKYLAGKGSLAWKILLRERVLWENQENSVWEILAGKSCGKRPLVGKAVLWENLAFGNCYGETKSCGKLLQENLVGKLLGKSCQEIVVGNCCRKLLWVNLVGKSCGKILWEIVAGKSCGKLLSGKSCGKLL